MTREEVRLISMGQYVNTHKTETLDKSKIDDYVEGALFCWDLLHKQKIKTAPSIQVPIIAQNNVTELINGNL